MPTVTVIDPFERNKKKLAIVQKITNLLLEHFPNHIICRPSQYRFSTNYFSGEPVINTLGEDITKVEFGLHTPFPEDTRKRKFGIAVGELERPRVIANIKLEFLEGDESLHKATISVFGTQNKAVLLKFAHEFETEALAKLGGLVYLVVSSEETKDLC